MAPRKKCKPVATEEPQSTDIKAVTKPKTKPGFENNSLTPDSEADPTADTNNAPKRGEQENKEGEIVLPSLFRLENPLMNALVLCTIFEFVGALDLKECRLVSKTWSDIASRFLAQRTIVRLNCGTLKCGSDKKKTQSLKKFQSFVNRKSRGGRSSTTTGPFINFKNFYVQNFDFSVLSRKLLFMDCGGFITSLHLYTICESDFNFLVTCIYHNLHNLKELNIVFSDSDSPSLSITENSESIPEENRVPLQLRSFSLTDTLDDTERFLSFDWKLFFDLCPRLEELEINAESDLLSAALEPSSPNFHWQNLIRKLTVVLGNDDFVGGVTLDRNKVSNLLKSFVSRTRCEELSLNFNLSAPQWKQILDTAPTSLKTLSLTSDWCLGTLYPENEYIQPDSNSNLDYFLSSFENCHNLTKLSVRVLTEKVDNKKIRMMINSKLVFPGITSLSWIFKRKYAWSWQTAFPKFFSIFPGVFPNLVRLETTVHTRTSLKELLSSLPNLEDLVVSEFSKCKIQDVDIIGDEITNGDGNSNNSEGQRKRRDKKNSYNGMLTLKKLRVLRLECSCFKLTDASIFHGFLQLPKLSVLEIFQANDFSTDATIPLMLKLERVSITRLPPSLGSPFSF